MSVSLCALIVEDLDFWQDTLREILTDAGCQVWVASNYTEAMDTLARNEFHLVMIDPVLDDTNRHNRDGLRVLQYILDNRPGTYAIVITSSDPKHIRRDVDKMSADVPVLWKDEWDDDRFLAIMRNLFVEET
jgi:CheY-like chemotaxis protein